MKAIATKNKKVFFISLRSGLYCNKYALTKTTKIGYQLFQSQPFVDAKVYFFGD